MLALRAVFAVAATALAVWLLLNGLPFGAVAVIALAILVRRAAENGRLRTAFDKRL